MFIPKRCPRCRDISGWREGYNPFLTNSLEKLVIALKGYNRDHYVYRCDRCGFECSYDNHAETLDRRR